ncbi:MAG: alanine--tRNA ligase-related protein [Candidatus Algichlamydia australiensis]|nr:alanine--tRNA ligase-related protein [Chlamydiales bacterium]
MEAAIVLDETPFYAEKGGQIGDRGELTHKGAQFSVHDTLSPYPGLTLHRGKLDRGVLLQGEPVKAEVDARRRKSIAAHHSATHLVHWALQQVLGSHAEQKGSLVAPDHLRFDFSHHKQVTQEELRIIEELVNAKIRENLPVETKEISFDEAQKHKEIKQIFGEKYGKSVRVVGMGEYSKELCGGTHTDRLGSLGYFRITKEMSVGAGVRRIEASCGLLAESFAYNKEDRLADLAEKLGCKPEKLFEKAENLLSELTTLKKKFKQMRATQIKELAKELKTKVESAGRIRLLTAKVDLTPDEMATFGNDLMGQIESGVILLAAEVEGRCQLLLKVSSDLVGEGVDAKQLIREIGPLIGGGGGGRPEAAQAGGKNPAGITDAFVKIKTLLSEK